MRVSVPTYLLQESVQLGRYSRALERRERGHCYQVFEMFTMDMEVPSANNIATGISQRVSVCSHDHMLCSHSATFPLRYLVDSAIALLRYGQQRCALGNVRLRSWCCLQ